MPAPVRLLPPLRNSNRPFWLFVLPGIGCTLIWSKSSSPEYSNTSPPLNVWRFFTHVVVLAKVLIGPREKAGYGPPSMLPSPSIERVGILSGISLFSGNRYGYVIPYVLRLYRSLWRTLMNTSSREKVKVASLSRLLR